MPTHEEIHVTEGAADVAVVVFRFLSQSRYDYC